MADGVTKRRDCAPRKVNPVGMRKLITNAVLSGILLRGSGNTSRFHQCSVNDYLLHSSRRGRSSAKGIYLQSLVK